MKTPRFLPVHFGSGLLALSGSTLLRALSMKILALGVFCLGWAALGSAPAQAGGVLGGWSDSGNAILSLAVMPDLTGDGHAEIAAGLNSGRVVCLSGAPVSPASLLWEAQLNGSASAVMALPFTGAGAADGDVVAATDLGQVARIRGTGAQKGQMVWTFSGLAGFASLAMLPDRNDDGWPEVLAGGADQRVYLRDGATGNEIWTCSLSGGYAYVHTIIPAGDLNGDAIVDIAVYTWEGKVIAINGSTGVILWSVAATAGFTDPLAAIGDLSGDGLWDMLVGGNDGILKLCSGSRGTTLWSASLGRPIRAAIVMEDVTGDGKPDTLALTAEGIVSCVAGGGSGTVSAHWTAALGDTGRVLAAMSDADADDSMDVAASAEDGTVAAFSGANGIELWRWAGPDTARSLVNCGDLNGDGVADLAAGCLDGSVTFLSGKPGDWTSLSSLSSSSSQSFTTKSRSAESARKTTAPDAADTQLWINAFPAHPQEEFPESAAIPSAPPPAQSTLVSAMIAAGASDVPLLLYHDVQPVMYYPYGVTVENFTAQMDLVVRGGYTPVTLQRVADWIAGRADLPDNPICITFDGPYEGQHTYGARILRERGLFATVYCTADWIGTANHCDWHQLREMESTGVVYVENHTLNHPSLTSLSQAAVTLQIKGCNDSIKKHLNGKVAAHHAYPGGAYNQTIMNYLKNLGITTATTVVQRHVVKTDDPLAIPRYSVVPTTTLENFKTKIRYTEPAFTPTPTASPSPTASPAPKVQGWLLR